MKNKFIYCFTLLILFSCHQNENKDNSDQPRPAIHSEELTAQSDDSANSLSPQKDTLVFNLTLDSANQHLAVPIRILAGDTLYANLASKDSKANIRISQLGFPDSTFDGPFGKKINYKIKDTGEYKIIIGENMMAGYRCNGNFELKAWVK
jgi:hypothetical protein